MIIKTFEHAPIPSLNFELERITEESGYRTYKTPDGFRYPSVTTVLSGYNKEGLDAWIKRVGEKEAERIRNVAALKGSKLHTVCEDYLNNNLSAIRLKMTVPDIKDLFLQIKPVIDENISKVYGIEKQLFSHKLKLAGTTDLICEWKGKIALVDWKTSAKEKKEEYIRNYFLQLTAYAEMFEERTGTPIDNIIVVMASNFTTQPQVFEKTKGEFIPELYKYVSEYHERQKEML